MARRNNNHWLDNLIFRPVLRTRRSRRGRIVREDNHPIVMGNGIFDQISNPNYMSWQEEETTAPM